MVRRLCIIISFVVLGSFAAAQGYFFDVTNIYEQQLVSHERIRFTVNTGSTLFPYSGMVGWRLMFSRYEIGDTDPQYEYSVWVLPARDADLSQQFWIVRPVGLVGPWHYRIDAVNSDRKPLATSRELIYTFDDQDTVYRGIVPYVASDGYWGTALALTNQTGTEATVTLTVYDNAGDPYPVEHGTNTTTVTVPANGTWSNYLYLVLGYAAFSGHITLASDQPLSWIGIVSTTDNPVGLMQFGEVK